MLGLGTDITSSSYVSLDLKDATTDLELWLKNNTGVAVEQWDDSSGNNNHVKQNTEANQAAVSGGGLDFERDDSDHYTFTKIDIADNQGFCVAVVMTRESNTSGCLLSDGSSELFQMQDATTLRVKTVNSSTTATTTDAVFESGTFPFDGTKFLLLVNRTAGVSNRFTFFKNGTALTPDTDTSTNEAAGENPGGIEFTVLGSRTGGSNFFDGKILELAIWSKGLSLQEITDVNDYLKSVHGL